jgi:hypothetical protein
VGGIWSFDVEDETLEDDALEDDTFLDDALEDDALEDDTFEDDTFEDDVLEEDTFADDALEDDTFEDDREDWGRGEEEDVGKDVGKGEGKDVWRIGGNVGTGVREDNKSGGWKDVGRGVGEDLRRVGGSGGAIAEMEEERSKYGSNRSTKSSFFPFTSNFLRRHSLFKSSTFLSLNTLSAILICLFFFNFVFLLSCFTAKSLLYPFEEALFLGQGDVNRHIISDQVRSYSTLSLSSCKVPS